MQVTPRQPNRIANATLGTYLLHVLATEVVPSSYTNTIEITTSLDTSTYSSLMSLRNAIITANSLSGTTLITFGSQATGNIELEYGSITVSSNVTIRGKNASTLTVIQRKANAPGELFQIASAGSLQLEDVALNGATSSSNGIAC
jgi:hypothetical protein